MQFINKLKYFLVRRKALKYTQDLCEHMSYVYGYLHSTHPDQPDNKSIKEAVGMLETWERVSDNLYKHKETGHCLEIKKEDDIRSVSKKILEIELVSIAKDISINYIVNLQLESAREMDIFFISNKI